jgi:hypothetical protein
MRIATSFVFVALAVSVCLAAAPAAANGGQKSMGAPGPILQLQCKGGFSNGASIDVANAVSEVDVGYVQPAYGQKPAHPPITAPLATVCDVHTFAFNQFIYLTSNDPKTGTARFMEMAPWYNVLTTGAKPGPYPGGPTDLRTAFLDQGQAGNDNHLLDVAGQTVRYDIRFDSLMYGGIVSGNLYTQSLFLQQCGTPDPKTGACPNENTSKMWMPPTGANEGPEPGSLEVKTSWRDFGAPGKCPSDFYCQGRFGLVGLHYVNKTFSHGEWIWATFEHVANDPDCMPTGDAPIKPLSPLGTPWSFFNDKTVPPGVLKNRVCSTAAAPPQCNGNPNPSGDKKTWVPVNVCRTVAAAAGGASAANCIVNPGSPNVAGNVSCLNATLMPQRSGPWSNYKLVGALWVKDGMGFMTNFRVTGFQSPLPGYQNAMPKGIPYLANTTMETWFQHNSNGYRQTGAVTSGGGADSGCFLCHSLPSSFGAHNRQIDLSHFPGKLPAPTLTALSTSLLRADSTAKAPN